jgi:hypothetical protein
VHTVDITAPQKEMHTMARSVTDMCRPFADWPENKLRNAIWIHTLGSFASPYPVEYYRAELRYRGLDDRGYHNT